VPSSWCTAVPAPADQATGQVSIRVSSRRPDALSLGMRIAARRDLLALSLSEVVSPHLVNLHINPPARLARIFKWLKDQSVGIRQLKWGQTGAMTR
jgi:hypothetical protein